MKNKIWLLINAICIMFWICIIYNSITTNNIANLRSYAIGGSIISVLLYIEHSLYYIDKMKK